MREKEELTEDCFSCIWLEQINGSICYCPFAFCLYDKKYRYNRGLYVEVLDNHVFSKDELSSEIKAAYEDSLMADF